MYGETRLFAFDIYYLHQKRKVHAQLFELLDRQNIFSATIYFTYIADLVTHICAILYDFNSSPLTFWRTTA